MPKYTEAGRNDGVQDRTISYYILGVALGTMFKSVKVWQGGVEKFKRRLDTWQFADRVI